LSAFNIIDVDNKERYKLVRLMYLKSQTKYTGKVEQTIADNFNFVND